MYARRNPHPDLTHVLMPKVSRKDTFRAQLAVGAGLAWLIGRGGARRVVGVYVRLGPHLLMLDWV